MTGGTRNQLALSIPFAQAGAKFEDPVGKIRDERIKAAFGSARETTEPGTERTEVANTSGAFPSARPRGMRISIEPRKSYLYGFVTEQRWQGYVTDVQDSTFQAVVYDATDKADDEIEEVELGIDEVNVLMRPLIAPGAIFFWDIGFQVDPSGQRIRQSVVVFPMIPGYSAKQHLEAKNRASERFKHLGWGRSGDAQKSEESTKS
jgi:hypothetical protein